MKTFHCHRCQQLVFFENVKCESCGALLGYVPELQAICAFEPAWAGGPWRNLHPEAGAALCKPCNNYAVENICNWMLPADSPDTLCPACDLTHIIPDLSKGENRVYWYRCETAKRRLLYSLDALGLPIISRREDPEGGLTFEFMEDEGDDRVMTGHFNGIITMNLAEADTVHLERTRSEMGEAYRTLLGHFRHEVGHYYFNRLVSGTSWETPFRQLFGDERADYGVALNIHYANGAPPNWQDAYVSSYAASHPLEDWAETWAHYLHMVDTIDTAAACGLELNPDADNEPELTDSTPIENKGFDNLMRRWYPLTYALNSLNRSLGLADAYPFTLAPQVVDKLRFVHGVITANSRPGTFGRRARTEDGAT